METPLTAQQQDVVARLCAGESITAAAHAIGIHRTTIHHWRRTNAQFALALADAQADRVTSWQQALASRTEAALVALDRLLSDERTSPSVRLKAIQLILNAAVRSQPVNPPEEEALRLRDLRHLHHVLALYQKTDALEQDIADTIGFQHSSTRSTEPAADESKPRPGRNTPCPCGSGRKYKQCCLNQRQQQPAA